MADVSTRKTPILEARDLWVELDGKPVLRSISFEVAAGESWAVIGGSHSGKSIFLKTMAGLIVPTQGSVLFQGRTMLSDDPLSVPWVGRMGYVSQHLGLRSNMTARENAVLPLLYHGTMPQTEANMKADTLFDRVGVSNGSHRPAMLSPGEQSLVALARALIVDPPVILLDNPMVVLDVDYSDRVIQLLDERRRQGLAVLSVCTSASVAKLLATNVKRLRDGIMEDIA